MRPFPTALMALALTPLCACGAQSTADITGTVAGHKMNATAYFWGGPYLVFTDHEDECLDMAWVKRGPTYENGGPAPTDYDMTALLFTFEATDVVSTNTNLEGDAPVDARLLVVEGDTLTVFKARTGTLVVDSVEEEGMALGNFDIGFQDYWQLSGDFEIEWCNNLKAKY